MGLTVLLAPTLATPAVAAAPQVRTQAPGFYRMMLGAFEVTVLSDGTAARPVDKLMSKPDEIRGVLARDHQALPTELSINAFLINTGLTLLLADTDAGKLFGPRSGGRLVANLRAAGYSPEQVDAVLLTHIHAGHSGGLSIGGNRVLPNAVVYIDKRDPDFRLNPAAEQAAPAANRTTFQQSHPTVDPYVAAGKLRPFPGVHSVPAYGHTPGHTAYMVASKGRHLLLWGDTIHLAEVQFADPEVTIEYDVDRDAAAASREALLAHAAGQGFLVGGSRISFPGLGHVHVEGNAYAWTPVPCSTGE